MKYNYLIRIYIITLKDKVDYIKSDNYNSIKHLNCNIILSKGIILNKKQSDKYKLYAKSSIGIRLAHKKIWKKLNNLNKNSTNKSNNKINKTYKYNDYSIILEDDAILNISNDEFIKELNSIIENKKCDLYRFHSDGLFISTAAYLIKHNTINNLLDKFKIYIGQIDIDLYILNLVSNYNVLTHNYNIFKTDETESTNRIDRYNFLNIVKGVKLFSRSDKDFKNILSFKIFRIFNYELIVFEIFLLILLIFSIILKNYYLFLIVIILFII